MRMRLILRCVLLFVFTTSVADAQPNWVHRYDGSAHDNDAGRDVIVLGDDVYVAGSTYIPGALNVLISQGLLLRLDRGTGARVWDRVFAAPQASSGMFCSRAVHNPHNDSLVLGCTMLYAGYVVYAFDRDGQALWSHVELAANARLGDVAVDSAGRVALLGNTGAIAIHVFDAAGAPLWNTVFGGPLGGASAARAVGDGAGGWYVAGTVAIAERGVDMLVMRMAAGGNVAWWQNFGGDGPFTQDSGAGIAVLGQRVVAGGTINGNTANYSDAFVVSLDTQGLEQWRRTYSAAPDGEDAILALTLDAQGNTYAAGVGSPARPQPEPLLLKLDGSGAVVYAHMPSNALSDLDVFRDVVVDAAGEAHAAGEVRLDAFNYGFLYTRLRPDGQPARQEVYPGPQGGGSRAWALALDADRNAYVVGASFSAGAGEDATTLRFGNELIFQAGFE